MRALPPSGPGRRRAQISLVLALGALGVLMWYQFGASPAAPASATSNSQARTQAPGAAQSALPSPLEFDKIDPVPDPPQTERNPFRFGPPPRPPAPPTPQPVVRPPGPPQPPPAPTGPPRISLTLVGLMDWPFPDGTQRRRGTLKDPSGALFHAFEGDKFDGRYRMVKVALESVIVSYLDGSGPITLPLSK